MAKKQKLELTWVGKDERVKLEPRVLIEESKKSYGDPNSENMLIFGDNLLSLKALEQDFARKIKCIYIDPPYNTGSAFEHYDDGVEHSLWLGLMRDRIEILWKLLRSDGAIWISIDDNEGHYLKVLCDEICGRKAFVSTVVWENFYGRSNAAAISPGHNYLLVYSPLGLDWRHKRNLLERDAKSSKNYKNPDNDPKGSWRLGPIFAAEERHAGLMYTVVTPSGREVSPPKGSHWRMIESDFWRMVKDGRISFGKKGNNIPAIKLYLNEVQSGLVPRTWWPHDEVGHTQEAKREVQALFPEVIPFDTPKPERILQRIIHISTNLGDLVLDSFAGSGTTGAVAHKMGRKWIMCELGEHCHTHIIPRMQKVIDGTDQGGISEAVNWKGGGSFKYYRLAESLLVKDKDLSTDKHPVYIINPKYDETLLIKSICKIENFRYRKDGRLHGISSEQRFLHVTTRLLTQAYMESLSEDIGKDQSLLIYCTRKSRNLKIPDNVEIKKIPRNLLEKCDFDEDKR
ncbi:hypothetical protein SCALIN_C31_0007 [Candidatus Scalindua japonica]|uniref:site-specific DNA-methyltransferase (adenine-specific) n=1 Tax=Candidatus Scalindua japonica TaxID=1284222 RepID=A0A286U2J9_9BACT|nr:site-specific DNA-methyltransferase [Candidatus Scalindua japonica]GAX62373.1 hypothetical protein SCALIN_C31_0007 [Candidatus Scalindua japonica]